MKLNRKRKTKANHMILIRLQNIGKLQFYLLKVIIKMMKVILYKTKQET